MTAGGPLYTERTPRVAAARRLTRRAGRDEAGEFLAEGPQAVREALAAALAGTVPAPRELFAHRGRARPPPRPGGRSPGPPACRSPR